MVDEGGGSDDSQRSSVDDKVKIRIYLENKDE